LQSTLYILEYKLISLHTTQLASDTFTYIPKEKLQQTLCHLPFNAYLCAEIQ